MTAVSTSGNSKYKKLPPAVSMASGKYLKSSEDQFDVFQRLLRKWRADTFNVSSLHESFEHEAFKQIVSMGEDAIPLIIDEIKIRPDAIVAALAIITGADPVNDEDRGNFNLMAVSWIEWYQNQYR